MILHPISDVLAGQMNLSVHLPRICSLKSRLPHRVLNRRCNDGSNASGAQGNPGAPVKVNL